MEPIPVTETVTRLPLVPPDRVNAYLVGGVLIDSGGRLGGRRLLRLLRDHRPSAHVLTHAHPDHQGCSRLVCQEFGIPLLNLMAGPGHPVAGTKPATMRKGLSEPFRFATVDRASNLRSARKLAALNPEAICFGHGPTLTDRDAFQRFVAGLPRL